MCLQAWVKGDPVGRQNSPGLGRRAFAWLTGFAFGASLISATVAAEPSGSRAAGQSGVGASLRFEFEPGQQIWLHDFGAERGLDHDVSQDHVPPSGWSPLLISPLKKPTQYSVTWFGDRRVLRARAHGSASGLRRKAVLDASVHRTVRFQWRADRLITDADNRDPGKEDAPLRLVLAFDGDMRKLPPLERSKMELAALLSGQAVPYATLMYIWENRQPVGAVIQSAHTSRVRMIVAESGAARLGQWLTLERDVAADFERAYGEPPGPLVAVGVMTDTDNTQSRVVGWYGPIEFLQAAGQSK